MKAHAPKTAALLAYAEGLLSPRATELVEAHLASCEVCARELAAIRAYDRLVDEAISAAPPEIAYDRMELALAREAKRLAGASDTPAPATRRDAPVGRFVLLGAAAAAALLVFAVTRDPPGLPERAPLARVATETVDPTEPGAREAAPRLSPTVTLASADASRLVDGAPAPVEVGETLTEGDGLRTEATGLVHVRLREGSGFALGAASEVTLVDLHEDHVALALAQGEVGNAVRGFSRTQRYLVLAGGHQVSAVGTQYVVRYHDLADGGLLEIDVTEGTVEVETPDGERFELTAPARWRSDGSAARGEPPPVTVRERDETYETLVTLRHPQAVRWQIDGEELAAAGLQLRMSPGPHEVRGYDPRGRTFGGLVRIGDAPTLLDEGALRPEAPHVRPGHLEDADIRRVVARGRRQIAQCYELALRRGSHAYGAVRLRLEVDPTGGVREARLHGLEDDSGVLSSCIESYAGRWTFPPPGGPVSLELPLQLTSTSP